MAGRRFWDRETWVRAASGVVFVAVLLGTAALGPIAFVPLWTAVGFGSFLEWRRHAGPAMGGLAILSRFLLFLGLAGAMVSIPWSAGQGFDPNGVYLFLILVWTNDTMAYVFGRMLGRNKLMPSVSPGKTWEGFVGGVLAAAGVAWVWTGQPMAAFLGAMTGVLATAGDLTQSAWKRRRELKDSGAILPGHGGFLDRFDGFLYALPAYAAMAWWSGELF